MRFPSIKAVASELCRINTQDSASTEEWSGIEDDSCIDVRLCIEDDGSWSVRWGDSSYDQRHSPICAASSVPGDSRRFNSTELARQMLSEARDQHMEQESYKTPPVTEITREQLHKRIVEKYQQKEPLIHPQTAVDSTDPAVIAVADAAASNLPVTPDMLVGLPATICHPNDRYPAEIIEVSPSLHTIVVKHTGYRADDSLVFRRDKLGVYRAKGGSPRLHIGHAETHRCEEI